MNNNFFFALLLTALAGLSTTLGSLIGLFVKKPGHRFMSATLGFSAGIMVMVSFLELLPTGIQTLGFTHALLGFFAGIIFIFIIDALIPHQWIVHQDYPEKRKEDHLLRMGFLVALGIGIHNFPEGMATFAGTLENANLGIAIAVAIAIHNIPEGLAVSAPVYAATLSRGKAFLWSFLSGVAEPVGAGITAVFLYPFLTQHILGWLLAFVAGIMTFISFDELIPTSKSFDPAHVSILGMIMGMAVMALSLGLLK